MKPGYKTTEFYLSALAMAAGMLLTFGAITPEQGAVVTEQGNQIVQSAGVIAEEIEKIIGAAMAIAAAFGYSLSRGLAKKGEGK